MDNFTSHWPLVVRKPDGTLERADEKERAVGVAKSDSIKAGDSHYVEVIQNPGALDQ